MKCRGRWKMHTKRGNSRYTLHRCLMLESPAPLYRPPAAYCGHSATKSCECYRRCKEWYCRADEAGANMCEYGTPPGNRGCYEREGVPPEQQASRLP